MFGLGPVGLCGVLVGKALGARVIGVDLMEERLELALQLGVDEVVDAGSEDVSKRLKVLTGGDGPGLAFETSGSGAAHQQLIDSLTPALTSAISLWERGPVLPHPCPP